MKPEVTHVGFLDMQVCVPSVWNDKQVKDFADTSHECGTDGGWFVRKQKDYDTSHQERVECSNRTGFVHVMLDA